ncbi:MAG: CDP-glucose 4,6-dehydratase [Candidatus Omnitrophica bacterium]|nr:CDP-glucose 4,6-dehydratase [Candidatus Omnitrophota bacterium]
MENKKIDSIFKNIYQGKKVLVTGDTGFKGSLLSIWLTLLGADVTGFSSYLPSKPCLFSVCGVDKLVNHIDGDVRDYEFLKKIFTKNNFDFVFHLAAQPIVNVAYLNPKETFAINVLGTVNILECIRNFSKDTIAIIITSDKCYKNMGWSWGYRETDHLGGWDPYSASKACAELVCEAYFKSYAEDSKHGFRMATARAGNVIGGGDWALNRIIPDCVRAWSENKVVCVRNPQATRPWQHVLEPLSGYLWLGQRVSESRKLNGESFNFGPDYKVSESVGELIKLFSENFGGSNKWKYLPKKSGSKESLFLKVSSDKALKSLNWYAVLTFPESIKMTAEWYEKYYKDKNKNMLDFTIGQIEYYISKAQGLKLAWAKV